MEKVSAKIYNQNGEVVGEKELNPEIFNVPVKKSVIHQVVVAQQANNRQVLAHTKTRDEVSGGGKKPWRQKGTGRARQGSIRSPQWRGGGIVFGPTKERNFKLKVNKKVKQKALFMAISAKVSEAKLILIDQIEVKTPKTKSLVDVFKKLPLGIEKKKTNKVLFLVPSQEEILKRIGSNVSFAKVSSVNNINVVDLLNNKYLLMPIAALQEFEKNYQK